EDDDLFDFADDLNDTDDTSEPEPEPEATTVVPRPKRRPAPTPAPAPAQTTRADNNPNETKVLERPEETSDRRQAVAPDAVETSREQMA
ncbi:hypothetical protein NVV43_26560, partial [Escherichia marmotae]|nr:hypothetical protein [Escherichia marmotae]